MKKIIAVLSLAALLAFPLQLGAGAAAQEYVLDSEGVPPAFGGLRQ